MTVYYLDTSIAVRILKSSDQAKAWFEAVVADDDHGLISSRLLRVELTRVLRREGEPPAARQIVLRHVNGVPLTEQVLIQAEAIGVHVRTLDAIHLASALDSGLDPVVVTHDTRMKEVAAVLGLAAFDPIAA